MPPSGNIANCETEKTRQISVYDTNETGSLKEYFLSRCVCL